MVNNRASTRKHNVQVFQKKIALRLSTTVLQPCTTELGHFQQNVQKENVYTTKAIV